jgi:hypothetical protein
MSRIKCIYFQVLISHVLRFFYPFVTCLLTLPRSNSRMERITICFFFLLVCVTKLPVARLYRDERCDDTWMINWEESGRKLSWSN